MSDFKRQELRKHKAIATGLFFLMLVVYFALVYVGTLEGRYAPWMDYVKAFAEAGMVGALADWFAVTALFKYPMGLRIPHTNLIENSKNAIGENLGSFVTDNFLTPQTIRPYIEKLDAATYLSDWLQKSKNSQFLAQELRELLLQILSKLNDADIVALLTQKGKGLLEEIKLETWATQGLLYLIEHEEHDKLLSLLLPQARSYVENNREIIYKKVVEKQPILGLIGGKSVTNQLISGITTFLQDIENNKHHELRVELTTKLLELARDFSSDPSWQEKFNALKKEFISEEKIQHYVHDLWLKLKAETSISLQDTESLLSQYIDRTVLSMASSFNEDHEMQAKINTFIRQYVYKIALKKRHEIGTIISTTVAAWDGKELSEKLELEVGKDLQYIRVNGTLVGGLVGLLIYTLTHLLF